MPLVVICGYPSSGKTTICNQLKDFLENKNKKVIVVSENFLVDNKKNETYSGGFIVYFIYIIHFFHNFNHNNYYKM